MNVLFRKNLLLITIQSSSLPQHINKTQKMQKLLRYRKTTALLFTTGAITSSLFLHNKVSAQEKPSALDPNQFKDFRLQKVIPVNHNTKIFRFELPEGHVLGTFTASCVVVKAEIDGKTVIRPYTPISKPNAVGYFDLLVKKYENGVMSKYIHNLKEGDTLSVKGPITKYPYKPNMKKKIGMVAGGTGITPMYQVIREVLDNPEDKTELHLVFSNNTEEDILLREEFEELQKKHKNFHFYNTLTVKAEKGWNQGVGFVSKEMLEKHMFTAPPKENEEDVVVFVCGPPGFMNHVSGDKTKDRKQGELKGLLKEMGFTEKNVFKF